jgi:RNA polymerase sigma factor (sigma-70 family)
VGSAAVPAPLGAPGSSTVGVRMDSTTDADLVIRAQGGDRAAFGVLYDRFGARIFDLCAHMLRDPDEAADAAADVFLAAAAHIDQLEDPEKVKSWLYAIARNEVFRRSKRRSREVATDPADLDLDMGRDLMSGTMVDDLQPVDASVTAALLRDAALGLADRDRLVLELTLAGGLDGHALGDALGVSVDTAHQASHRMRERLATSLGALLVARQGREDCPVLQSALESWDGTYSVLWRKRIARHVDGCALCGERHRSIPRNVLAGTFAAVPITFLLPPSWLRGRVVDHAGFANGDGARPARRGRRWRSDGFPPVPDARRRRGLALIAGILVVLAVLSGAVSLASDDEPSVVSAGRTATTARGSTARVAPSTQPTAPPAVLDPGTTPTTKKAPGKTTLPPPPPPTAPPDVSGPSLSVNVPAQIPASAQCVGPTLGDYVSATASDPSGVTQVVFRYTGAAVGNFALDKVGATSWQKFWKPPAVGFYSVTITATDARGNNTSVNRSVEGTDIIC